MIKTSAGLLTKIGLHVNIRQGPKDLKEVYDSYSDKKSMTVTKNKLGHYEMNINKDVPLSGDINFEIRNGDKKHVGKLGVCWLN